MSRVDVSALGQVALFAPLERQDLGALASSLRRRRYGRGQVLFEQGDPGSSFYMILSGRVKISVCSPDGQELILNVLGPGACFGELALLDGAPRSAGAVVQEDCEVLVLERQTFLEFVRSRPDVALRLLAVLSQWLRNLTQVAQDEVFLDAPARLSKVLLQLARATGTAGQALVIAPAPTQAEIAAMVGVTRRSVNKWLAHFQRRGLISLEPGRITIHKPEELAERIGSGDE